MAELELARVGPDEAGLAPDRLARIARFVEDEVAADRMPGAVLGIVRGGRLAHLSAHGYRDKARGVPMTTDSLFWVASMTKPVTAVGALLLHERGRLVLDAPVGHYLPGFADRRVADLTGWDGTGEIPARPASRQPTLLDLLRHTAGIPEGMLGDSPVHARYVAAVGDGMTDYTAQEFADRLSELPLLFEPGTEWHYGWGLDLIGFIVESRTGRSLGSYLGEHVLGPLGMGDTTFGVPDGQGERFAVPLPTAPDTGAPQSLPDLSVARFHSGGAGLVSTAGDYLRFVRMLLAGGQAGPTRLLARKTVEYMLADHLDPAVDVRRLERIGWNPGHGFGLGVAVRRRVGGASTPGSAGEVTWPGAGGTLWWADPAEDLGVVFMAHVPSRIRDHYHQQVKALVLHALT